MEERSVSIPYFATREEEEEMVQFLVSMGVEEEIATAVIILQRAWDEAGPEGQRLLNNTTGHLADLSNALRLGND